MTPLLRLTTVCAVLAALCIGLDARMARAGHWLPPLPPTLLGWRSTDAPLSKATLAYMDNPRAVQRVFHAPSGADVVVSVIAVNGIESFHDPTVCAEGSGFAQVDVQPAPLDDTGKTARALGFQQGAARIVMCYWRQDKTGVVESDPLPGWQSLLNIGSVHPNYQLLLGRQQCVARVFALLAAACLLMAQTRSAWLGEAVSLVVLSLLAWRGQAQVKRVQAGTSEAVRHLRQHKHLVIGPLLILAGSLTLLVMLSGTGSDLQNRAHTLSSAEGNGWLARAPMWQGAWHAALARPFFGWGLGTYPVQAAHWTGFGDSAAQVLAHGTSHSNLAHNLYLQTAAEVGFVGLALYLAALVLFFRTGLRALPGLDNGLRRSVLLGSLAAVAGQVVDALGSPAYNFASVSLFQWTMLGLGMCAAGVGGRILASTPATDRAPSPLMRRAQWAFSGLAALALMTQIVPTMTSASATVTQTCTINGTYRLTIDGVTILTTPGQSTRVVSSFNTHPAQGVTYQYTYLNGSSALVTIAADTPGSIQITRTAVTAPNGAILTVTGTYTDGNGQPYTSQVTMQLRNPRL